MPAELPTLYVRTHCPWCHDVSEFLSTQGIEYREKNVSLDATALAEMERISGQAKAPVLDWHGTILSDFGLKELPPFLRRHDVKLEAR